MNAFFYVFVCVCTSSDIQLLRTMAFKRILTSISSILEIICVYEYVWDQCRMCFLHSILFQVEPIKIVNVSNKYCEFTWNGDCGKRHEENHKIYTRNSHEIRSGQENESHSWRKEKQICDKIALLVFNIYLYWYFIVYAISCHLSDQKRTWVNSLNRYR